MDPVETNNTRISETKKLLAEKITELDSGITIHDFRMVTGPTKTTLIFDAVVPFDSKLSDEEARRQIEELVCREFENSAASVKIDKTYI